MFDTDTTNIHEFEIKLEIMIVKKDMSVMLQHECRTSDNTFVQNADNYICKSHIAYVLKICASVAIFIWKKPYGLLNN